MAHAPATIRRNLNLSWEAVIHASPLWLPLEFLRHIYKDRADIPLRMVADEEGYGRAALFAVGLGQSPHHMSIWQLHKCKAWIAMTVKRRHDVDVAFRRGHPNASQVAVNVSLHMDSDIRCVHRDGAGFPLSYKISHEFVESGDEFVVGWIWHQSDMPEDKPLLMHSCCVTDGLNEIQLNAERIGHSLAVLEALWVQGWCKMQTPSIGNDFFEFNIGEILFRDSAEVPHIVIPASTCAGDVSDIDFGVGAYNCREGPQLNA